MWGSLLQICEWMVVFTAFVLSVAHSHVVACCMQTLDLMTLPWAGGSQGQSAPSARTEGQGNTDGECYSGISKSYVTSEHIELEMLCRKLYPVYFLFASWLRHSWTKGHFFPPAAWLLLFWTMSMRMKVKFTCSLVPFICTCEAQGVGCAFDQ